MSFRTQVPVSRYKLEQYFTGQPSGATLVLQPGPIFTAKASRLGEPRVDPWKVTPMNDFAGLLQNEIPRLRRYARALARDAARADDLVQSCLVRAIAKEHLWEPGTDLRAWLFTILHNQNVNEVRRSVREGVTVAIEDAASALTMAPRAGATLQLRDLERAIRLLPEEQRQVILLVGLEGMHYEEVAAVLDIPIGTVRSRLSRGRETLRRLMGMKEDAEVRFHRPHRRQNSHQPTEAA
jgi:RNA polymerase sigma-70 factor, ECF subfamily